MAKPKRKWTVELHVEISHWRHPERNSERFIDSCEIETSSFTSAKGQATDYAKANEEMGPRMRWQPRWVMQQDHYFRTYKCSPDGGSTNYFYTIKLVLNGFTVKEIEDEEEERRERKWRREYLNERD